MTVQLNILEAIAEGERLRDIGIAQAINHADAVSHGWSNKAFNLFCAWLKEKGKGRQITIESFRIEMQIEDKIEKPPSLRAWGAIAVKAYRQGLIKRVGYTSVVNPKAHMANCSLWQIV